MAQLDTDKVEMDKNRAIVHDMYEGMIIPNKHDEINRRVKLEEDSKVTEGIYAREIEALKDSKVGGPVFAHESLGCEGSTFESEVGASGSIIGEDSRFGAGITASTVNLSDCIVRTNVVGESVILKNSIVLGLVTGTERLEMKDSICHSFKSLGKGEVSDSSLLLPHAIADGEFEMSDPIECPLFKSEEGTVKLGESDMTEYEGTTYLTISPKVLNLKKIKENVIQPEQVLTFLQENLMSDRIRDGFELEFEEESVSERVNDILNEFLEE